MAWMTVPELEAALQHPAAALGLGPGWRSLRPRFHWHLHETVTSTNQMAWQQVAAGAPSGTVILAQQQGAGRGQRGRQWRSAPGGLYLSLVIDPELEAAQMPLVTLATAWGIAAVLNHLGLPIQIKWPNDLVYHGQKVGGILTETRQGATWTVIGIGLNWANAVPATGQSLQPLLPDPPPSPLKTLADLAAIALRGTLQGLSLLHNQGPRSLIDHYQVYWVNQGQAVTVAGHPGTVVGVSTTGQIQVQGDTPHGVSIQSLNPGEIQLGYRGPD